MFGFKNVTLDEENGLKRYRGTDADGMWGVMTEELFDEIQEREPTEYELDLQKLTRDYAQAIAPNALYLNEAAGNLLSMENANMTAQQLQNSQASLDRNANLAQQQYGNQMNNIAANSKLAGQAYSAKTGANAGFANQILYGKYRNERNLVAKSILQLPKRHGRQLQSHAESV